MRKIMTHSGQKCEGDGECESCIAYYLGACKAVGSNI